MGDDALNGVSRSKVSCNSRLYGTSGQLGGIFLREKFLFARDEVDTFVIILETYPALLD